ncbi:glutathione S-transferase family protein [Anabaena cylindrica FACHB-243]|uniref:Glutathione S-transferase domain protein n=1 Tax=Anabaena cylindrica (strain ATCC 27899 / PCC 7122) TaxID=272123 RepID=K9ZK60_ANACC|nr:MULTISPECIES: glutathione S-transferase family protein [Anabaena]AFZ58937.1 Glutathione S-transferase domain protein [Anabaena cylindrica PCC 7122]MBD2420718.1 glutathione S-transferase family protein [Anabaena cylindrica FACHB-243]MBY5285613.1 glutathione S-transferase family protein [Anabaena sp. CCAP 1446/1C]MBY5310442.1 glutathione S-transferase family protein [Anabaena sp. CCAP 1446/1C]MCM2408388.1 glutathione S-transferase family protein [Anabaena sp. CCAP 1446/1C]
MLKLYGSTFSRASIVQWYLEELEVPYEFVLLDMKAGEHRQPEYLAINPIGKVPAIVDGDFQLWESGAILLYLAEKYGNKPLSLEERAIISQWVLFGNSSLATGIFVEANREREMPRLLTSLNEILEQQPFLLGNEFTAADVAVGSILAYIPIMLKLDLSAYSAVLKYIQQINERPAFQKSIGAGRS